MTRQSEYSVDEIQEKRTGQTYDGVVAAGQNGRWVRRGRKLLFAAAATTGLATVVATSLASPSAAIPDDGFRGTSSTDTSSTDTSTDAPSQGRQDGPGTDQISGGNSSVDSNQSSYSGGYGLNSDNDRDRTDARNEAQEAQAQEKAQASQAEIEAEQAARIETERDAAFGPMEPSIYRTDDSTLVVGTPLDDEVGVFQNEITGDYQVQVNNRVFDLNDEDLDRLALVGNGGMDVITGSDLSETIVGGRHADNITAGGGDDLVFAGPGNDNVYGGVGDDEIHGGDGDDFLTGDNDNDLIYGNDGNDTIEGRNGDDQIFGGNGDDVSYGNNGNDQLNGGEGNDYNDGGRGADKLNGDAGRDIQSGGYGNDLLDGGVGQDTTITGPGRDRVIDTDNEVDKVYAQASDKVQTSGGDVVERVVIDELLADPNIQLGSPDPNFWIRLDSDLTTLRSFPAGQAVLDRIAESERIVVVRPLEDPRGVSHIESLGDGSQDHLRPTGEPGDGQDALLDYGIVASDKIEAVPDLIPLIELGHELVHAGDLMNGTADPGLSTELDQDGNALLDPTTGEPVITPDGELQAVGLPYDQTGNQGGVPWQGGDNEVSGPQDLELGRQTATENALRRDLNIPDRTNYATENALASDAGDEWRITHDHYHGPSTGLTNEAEVYPERQTPIGASNRDSQEAVSESSQNLGFKPPSGPTDRDDESSAQRSNYQTTTTAVVSPDPEPAAVCVDEGSDDRLNWGVNLETNEGCWISGSWSQQDCVEAGSPGVFECPDGKEYDTSIGEQR